jgi:predicted XRE-type DNA-binding protein
MDTERDQGSEGEQSYLSWREQLLAESETQTLYEEEATKKELWLQLTEARHEAGLTQAEVARRLCVSQAQVARIEKRGYESYTLTSLRRYLEALDAGFTLDVSVRRSRALHLPKASGQ